MLPPPRFVLFPYTTLFRSPGRVWIAARGVRRLRALQGRRARSGDAAELWPGNARGLDRAPPLQRTDRKSTRLNSSHRCISYAVFCLKKKTKKIEANAKSAT